MGFRAQMRELLKQEPMVLARVTERTLPKFEATLTQLSEAAGMLPVSDNPQETNAEWAAGTRGLWVFGQRESDFSNPEQAAGFVNVYMPEHSNEINDWLVKRKMRAYDHGALIELSSFVKDVPGAGDMELSADKQALAKVFMDDEYKDVRAVTTWITHTPDNKLDVKEVGEMKKLGGWPLGTLKYNASEPVDSTCFLITRNSFMEALSGKKRPTVTQSLRF